MDPTKLIPTPDTIPAPSWLFLVLNVFTFLIHILFINVALGGSLIALVSRFKGNGASLDRSLDGAVSSKIPTTFALGITFGVAPLLFLQVIYGHLFYTSSVLMAVYWILIIPLLILAYYGAYIHMRNYNSAAAFSKIALLVSSVILLYIALVFVNNNTLMLQPEKWSAYFQNRGGTILNLGDATFLPRYLHFVTASVAVGGLFLAIVWWFRQKKNVEGAEEKIKTSLQIFGFATAVQVMVGFWFLLALPREIMLQFMGGNLVATILLFAGVILGIGAIILAFLNKLIPTLIHLVVTVLLMVISRAFLRSFYLSDKFRLSALKLTPQYGVMALFFIIFVIGLVLVYYMAKIFFSADERRVA